MQLVDDIDVQCEKGSMYGYKHARLLPLVREMN